MNTLGKTFLESAISRLRYYKDLGEKTFEQLEDAAFHFQVNEASNSIATIVQHMTGNMLSRWTNFLTEDGEKEWRERDREFQKQATDRKMILEQWEEGWACVFSALKSLNESDLLKTIYIRKEPLTVVDAINRQLAHYPYHVGQIIYIAKIIKDESWKSLSIPKGESNQYNQEKWRESGSNR